MGDDGDRQDAYVDRSESKLNSWHPAQINSKKVTVTQTARLHTESQANVSRSELNVEIAGVRESHLTSTTKVVTNTVRTVYGRSLSGSTSSNEDGSSPVKERDQPVFESHSPTAVVDGGVWESYKQTTESHFISQTYHVDPPDSPSKSVTAIQNVMFRCHKEMDLKSNDKVKAETGEGEEPQTLRFVDRCEEVMVPEAPALLGSPGFNSSTQTFVLGYAGDESSENRLKLAREEVKHMIETSYIANDISDVIDDQAMSPQPLSLIETESSVDKLPAEVQETLKTSTTDWNSGKLLEEEVVQLNARSTESLPSDKDSPRRLSYSPGIAIRSYALEELAEKKSKDIPENLESEAKSLRFDSHSSQVDVDGGSSVDDIVPTVFHATEASESALQPTSANTMRFGTPAGAVILEESSFSRSAPFDVNSHQVIPMTEEERRESEDKLENLVDITAGYRFHDVGMMLDLNEGICNPAFDAAEDQVGDQLDGPISQLGAQDQTFLQMKPEERTVVAPMLMSASTAMSLQSSPNLTSRPPVRPDSGNQDVKSQSSSDSRSKELPSSDELLEAPMLMSAFTATSLQSSPNLTSQPPVRPDSGNQDVKSQSSSNSRSKELPSSDELLEAPMLMSAFTATSLQSSPNLTSQPPVRPDSGNQDTKSQSSSDGRSKELPSADEILKVSAQPCLKSSLPVSSPVALVPKKSAAVQVKKVGPPVQVTRHFTMTKKFESALKSLGARLNDESFHIDVYYDTPTFDLTLADSWLRSHNGKWQFHANFTTLYAGEKSGYLETEESTAILSKVSAILHSSLTPDKVRHSVALYVQKSGLREFARYTTTTKRYQLGDMVVELVMPQYGFWTGRVTSTAPCKAQTHEAVKGIDDLWKKTGVTALSLVSSS